MNLDKLASFAISVVIAAALAGNLDSLTRWVIVAHAKLLYESRTETWGSPYFFKDSGAARISPSKAGRR